VELTPLTNHWFEKFTAEDARTDVFYRFCKIEPEDLVLPALNPGEREKISQCNYQTRIASGLMILNPVVRHGEFDLIEDQSIKGPLDVPLLRSLAVRERLHFCLEHPREVTLILHAFSVTIFDHHLNRFDLFYRADQKWIFEKTSLENGLRRMFSSFLPSFSAVMLHSSGAIRGNRAALFFASDEGGKSTVLKNLTQGTELSDDRNIIRQEGDIFTAYSTPWGQNNNGPQQAGVGGLFLIEKAQTFGLFPIAPSSMVVFLWNEHIQFWETLPKFLRIKAFELIADLCYRTPCYQMHFPKNFVDWDAIDKILLGTTHSQHENG
jgi:hypothetical protein